MLTPGRLGRAWSGERDIPGHSDFPKSRTSHLFFTFVLHSSLKFQMKSRFSLLVASIIVTAMLVAWAVYQRRAQSKISASFSSVKPPWAYWSWRIFVPVVYATFAYGMEQAIARPDEYLLLLVLICLGPLLLVSISGWFTWQSFNFDYSVFGKYRRTVFPNEAPLKVIRNSSAIIGRHRTGPLVT